MTARPPLDISGPGIDRPGLTEDQKKQLATLVQKAKNGKKITPYEEGRLAAFSLFATGKDAEVASRLHARARRQRQKEQNR